jgi:putative hemolysin
MLLTGRLPQVTDTVQWEGWRFEVVDMDGKAIDKVLAIRLPDTVLELADGRSAG